jgi:hypothetical protein
MRRSGALQGWAAKRDDQHDDNQRLSFAFRTAPPTPPDLLTEHRLQPPYSKPRRNSLQPLHLPQNSEQHETHQKLQLTHPDHHMEVASRSRLDMKVKADDDSGDVRMADDKPTYRSWKKKYRKMRIIFDQKMHDGEELHKLEQKALATARRLAVQKEYALLRIHLGFAVTV